MTIKNSTISLNTKEELQIIDITDKVKNIVLESGVKNGIINIQSLHTTASIVVNENEPLLLEDFKKHLKSLSSRDKDYNHDDFDRRTVNMCPNEPKNGCSHCRALHLPTNVCLNIINNQLQLGVWQRIFFIELDRPKNRKIQLQILGQ